MSGNPAWTGTLAKGIEPGTVVGELVDSWGWKITLHGTLQPGGGDPPECLHLPAIDSAK